MTLFFFPFFFPPTSANIICYGSNPEACVTACQEASQKYIHQPRNSLHCSIYKRKNKQYAQVNPAKGQKLCSAHVSLMTHCLGHGEASCRPVCFQVCLVWLPPRRRRESRCPLCDRLRFHTREHFAHPVLPLPVNLMHIYVPIMQIPR